jgi:putative tryptophan/tyrosine transport system substrate-binding protein
VAISVSSSQGRSWPVAGIDAIRPSGRLLAHIGHRCATAGIVLTPGTRAQSSAKKAVIGLLDLVERPEWWDPFKQHMRELGYVDGRDVTYVGRFARENVDTLAAMAKELVELKVAVIVTAGAAAAMLATRATSRIPIVMATGADQVSLGLVPNLARPGGNVTGMSSLNSELTVKRFDLLREVVPKVSRLAALWHSDNVASMPAVRDLESAATRSRVAFQSFSFAGPAQLPDAFAAMTRERIEGVVVVGSPVVYAERRTIVGLAQKHKLPCMYGASEYVEAGGLMSHAAIYADLFRRAAFYVDKILKGANPGDLPIEQPTTFERVINTSTVRALGIAFPASLLARANRVTVIRYAYARRATFGAISVTPISESMSRTALTAWRISSGPMAPMHPTRNVSTCGSLGPNALRPSVNIPHTSSVKVPCVLVIESSASGSCQHRKERRREP